MDKMGSFTFNFSDKGFITVTSFFFFFANLSTLHQQFQSKTVNDFAAQRKRAAREKMPIAGMQRLPNADEKLMFNCGG